MGNIDPESPVHNPDLLEKLAVLTKNYEYFTANVKDVNMVPFMTKNDEPYSLTGERLYAEDVYEVVMTGKLCYVTDDPQIGIARPVSIYMFDGGLGVIFINPFEDQMITAEFSNRPSEDEPEGDPIPG